MKEVVFVPLPTQRFVNEGRFPIFLRVLISEFCETVVLIMIEWIDSSLGKVNLRFT